MVLVGDAMVGKSCFLRQFRQGKFTFEHIPTESTDFALKVIEHETETVKVQLWDTSDSLRYGRLTKSYFTNVLGMAQAVILMFDITEKKSFDNIDRWLETIMNMSSSEVIIGLVGTKGDQDNMRQVPKEVAATLAQGLGLEYFEVSAKDGEGINHAVNVLAAKVLELTQPPKSAIVRKRTPNPKESNQASERGNSSIVNLNSADKENHKDCCKTS